ncbi:MAG: adenine deaminase [Bacillota bacterium]
MGTGMVEHLKNVISVARRERPAELLLTGGRLVNVFTREITAANVAVQGGVIAGIGEQYSAALQEIDAAGRFLIPGLIDAHLHIESSLLLPWELARAALRHGTTAVIADPHEIANVLGTTGVEFMLAASEGLPLDFFFTIPSCVPATAMETAGAGIDAAQTAALLRCPRVVGLAEMMNYPGVLSADEAVLCKMAAARAGDQVLDGHAPGLTGADLQAYLSSGISTDHECINGSEVIEKIRNGMKVIIRQGSAAQNLAALLPAVAQLGSSRFMLGSDDREAADLLENGHMNAILRQAAALGGDPLSAVQMATLNTALHYRLPYRGALAPGYRADLVMVDDLRRFNALLVVKDGRVVAREGKLTAAFELPAPADRARRSVRLARPVRPEDFSFEAGPAPFPVIGVVPNQIITQKLFLEPTRSAGGAVVADPKRDLLKLAVVERHRNSGRFGLGLVKGLGLKEGAIASSVSHDSHNLIVAGVEEQALAAAVNALAEMEGGFVVVNGAGETLASLPLPVAGLMSLEPAETVAAAVKQVTAAAYLLGAKPVQPFLTLSFLALPVIPHLKLTDRGLVDVDTFRFLE